MEISILGFCLGLLLLIVPLYILQVYKVKFLYKILRGFIKMLVTLGLTGVCLYFVFKWDIIWVNIAWILLMMLAGTLLTTMKAKLNVIRHLLPIGLGVFSSVLVVGLYFLLVMIGTEHSFDTRYLVPVFGLLIGGVVATNSQALRTYYMGMKNHGKLYYYLIGNGATRHEALRFFEKRALEKVSIPCISKMALMMVGYMPLVMWSMLVAGCDVLSAVGFQIVILIAVFCASVISMVVTLRVASKLSIDKYGKLKMDHPKQESVEV